MPSSLEHFLFEVFSKRSFEGKTIVDCQSKNQSRALRGNENRELIPFFKTDHLGKGTCKVLISSNKKCQAHLSIFFLSLINMNFFTYNFNASYLVLFQNNY